MEDSRSNRSNGDGQSGTALADPPPALGAVQEDPAHAIPTLPLVGAETRRFGGVGRTALLLLVFLVGLAGLYGAGRAPRMQAEAALAEAARVVRDAPLPVNVVKPERAAAETVLSLPAEAQAFDETTIFARTSGYVKSWLVDIGDHVKNGQLLATIDTPELDQQLIEAGARVNALQADVRLAEAQLDFAKATYERWESAAPEGAVSKQERDEKKAQFANAEAKLDAAKAQLELGQATVKKLEFETSFKNVVAPFDGVITQRHIDIGSLITAGSTASTTPLYSVARYDQVRIFVDVPQAAIPDVHVGMTANITAPREYPGRSFAGQVDRTAGAIDPSSRTLKVEVLAPNPDLTLLPGMYVNVGFDVVCAQPPLVIQAGSLNLRAAGTEVAIIGPDQRAHFRNVKVARDLGDTVEIASGLQANDWVALNISDEVADGDLVRPVPLGGAPAVAAAPGAPAGPAGAAPPAAGAVAAADTTLEMKVPQN